jgi:hypothetical protein
MKHELVGNTSVIQERLVYETGELEYLHFNSECADPSSNKMVVVPGFTQGIEQLRTFGEALAENGQREVFVLDQLERYKKMLDFSGKQGLEQQVETLLALLEDRGLTHERVDFVGNSIASIVLAKAAIRADERGWNCFKHEPDEEGRRSNTFFISPSGIKPKEGKISLGLRWALWIARNGGDDKILDPTREFYKAGQRHFFEDIPKTFNEYFAQAKNKIDFRKLGSAGIKPHIVGFANDMLMPYQDVTEYLDYIEGAHSLVDHAGNAPIYKKVVDGEVQTLPYPGAKSFDEFKALTGFTGKEARQHWVHHYRAAEHNNMQFNPDRTARFISQVLKTSN